MQTTMFDEFRRPFDILGLDPTASEEEIDKRRRHLLLEVHPDKTRGDEATKQASEEKTREYNKAHEEAISLVRDPWFQQIKTLILQHNSAEEVARQIVNESDERLEKKNFFSRMIDILSDHRQQLNDNYNGSEFKKQVARWTAEQYNEANNAVQHGLSDSRKMLSEMQCQLEKAIQENARLREQVRRDDTQQSLNMEQATSSLKDMETKCAAKEAEIQALKGQLQEMRDQFQGESEQKQMLFERKLKEMETHLTKRAEIAESKVGEWGVLEDKLHTLQSSLEDETRRAEMAEDSAKEWEQKYNANAKLNLTSNVEGEALSDTERAIKSKHRKYKHQCDSVNERVTYSMKVREFVQNHIRLADPGNLKFLGTKTIYHAFQAHNSADEFKEMNFIHFSMEVAKHLTEIFPAVRHKKTNQTKGYIGIHLQ
jgi:curved DNA-binding protein CbpA